MNRSYGRSRTGLTLAGQLLLTAYFLFFFAWLLPNHALTHEQPKLSHRLMLAQTELEAGQAAHNADQCQLCRAHAQMDICPANPPAVILPSEASPLVSLQDHLTNAGRPLSLSSRAPPVAA